MVKDIVHEKISGSVIAAFGILFVKQSGSMEKMIIDRNAPLFAEQEILISAPLEKVWNILTDIDRWSEWQPGVTQSKLDGQLAEDALFHWKANGMSINSVIRILKLYQKVGWTGKSFGMQANHIWSLAERNQETLVSTQESISGWLSRILSLLKPDFLEKSLAESLQVLKIQVEKKL